jgi:predicted dehydrogenase
MRDNEDAPEYFDWNLFRGPAPMRPFNWDIVQDGGWKRFWETGGGDTSDDGVHQLDVARFLIGDPACPTSVAANGGKIAFNDDGEVPDTLSASYTYDGVLMTFDLTQWAGGMHKIPTESRNTDKFPNWAFTSSRIEVYGTEAHMYFGRQGGGWQVLAPDNSVIDEFPGREPTQDHRKNWLECIRTREKPNADIAIGVSSALLAHLPNIAVRLGGAHLRFDADALTFKDNAAAQDLVRFAYRDGFEVLETV